MCVCVCVCVCSAHAETLRDRFGLLGGYTGSDMGNVMQLGRNYGFAKDGPTAVKLAMEAGLDQNMGGQYVTYTKGLIESGELSNATLDRAVGNILRKKLASGLFDQAPTDPAAIAKNVGSAAHRGLAREAARQGLTLLINSRPDSQQRLGCINVSTVCPEGEVVCPLVLGCKADGNGGRILPTCVACAKALGNSNCPNGTVVAQMSLGVCARLCAERGFARAGAEDGHECWCGDASADSAAKSTGCRSSCSGNQWVAPPSL